MLDVKMLYCLEFPENSDIVQHGGVSTTNDAEKVSFSFTHIGVNENVVERHFRLGKQGQDPQNPRPIKVILNSGDSANDVLLQSRKLKSYETHNIYMKPDKSKSEQKEFTRLGKRKKELLEQNPTVGGQEPRVKLEKGVLKLDNVEVDRYSPVQSLFWKMKPDASAIINLKILFWNVNGRCRFLNDPIVHKWVSDFNVMFISETHLTKGQKFVIEGYIPFHNSFSKTN